MYLPEEIWELIYYHRASIIIQEAIKRRNLARLHYGHVHNAKWMQLKKYLLENNVLHRIYPFPLARREWRTEIESWCRKDIDLQELAKDMEENTYWGAKSTALILSN